MLTPAQLADLVGKQEREIVNLRRQVAWFQHQNFGQKSEKRHPDPESVQGILGVGFDAVPGTALPAKKTVVASHERKAKPVPAPNPDMELLKPDQYSVIGEKITHRTCGL